MENKEEKVVTKTSGGVKVLLVILILALIGTSGFIVYDKLISKDNESKSNTKEETKKEEKKESVKKVDETKEYVYSKTNETNSNVLVPYINIDSEDAKTLNSEIESWYEKRIDDYNDYIKDNTFKYNYYTNDDVISLINQFVVPMGGDSYGYKVININKSTGKEVTREEILKLKNITREEMGKKMFEIFESDKNIENYKTASTTSFDESDEKITAYEANKIIFETYELDKFEVFLNDNNELCVITKRANVAGALYSSVLFNLDAKVMKEPAL